MIAPSFFNLNLFIKIKRLHIQSFFDKIQIIEVNLTRI